MQGFTYFNSWLRISFHDVVEFPCFVILHSHIVACYFRGFELYRAVRDVKLEGRVEFLCFVVNCLGLTDVLTNSWGF